MSRYNLLDEKWISVFSNKEMVQKDVSLLELFEHADDYSSLAGDTETQNFAVMRLLLAVLQTVFSRYDADGRPHPFVEVDDHMRQVSEIDPDDDEDEKYPISLRDTWKNIWAAGHFPKVIGDYLQVWKDRFYLFDDKYPFYQVPKDVLDEEWAKGSTTSPFSGANLNRTISESGNKQALFSPKADEEKSRMTYAELARWLITFQGYIGTGDKGKMAGITQPSKGWLYSIGGLYLSGDNLFQTLMMNFMPVHAKEEYTYKIQRPCWEFDNKDFARKLSGESPIDNLAELYTNWGRAVIIDQDWEPDADLALRISKLQAVDDVDNFLEPMTIWNKSKSGENKGHFIPRVHKLDQSMWRSFGLITMKSSSDQHQAGIMSQYKLIKDQVGEKNIAMHAVSMISDGNATSWLPVDEAIDALYVDDIVITDDADVSGWVVRINEAIETTKSIIDKNYYGFLSDIGRIRFGKDGKKQIEVFVRKEKARIYKDIDRPFRNWLSSIKADDNKEERVIIWKKAFMSLILKDAGDLVERADSKELMGMASGESQVNIITVYNKFFYVIHKVLDLRRGG